HARMADEKVDERHARVPVGAGHRCPNLHDRHKHTRTLHVYADPFQLSPAKSGEYPAKPGEGGSLRFLPGRSVAVEGVPAPGYHVVQLEPEDPVAFQRLANDLDPRFELRLNNGVGTCFLEAADLGRV